MRRCTYCFRFQTGKPVYCAFCGRSFDVRICSRGHRNPRGVQFCAECGSADLSTPTPPASLLHRVSGVTLYFFAGLTIVLIVAVPVLALFLSIDFEQLAPAIVRLVLVVGFLYWTTTLLPGPIKRIGKAAGRHVSKAVSTSIRKRKQ